jgi:hypothetical protein
MTLLNVHKVSIAMGILLGVGIALRAVANGSSVWMVAASATAAIALALYLRWFIRNERSVGDAVASSSKSRRDNSVQPGMSGATPRRSRRASKLQ